MWPTFLLREPSNQEHPIISHDQSSQEDGSVVVKQRASDALQDCQSIAGVHRGIIQNQVQHHDFNFGDNPVYLKVCHGQSHEWWEGFTTMSSQEMFHHRIPGVHQTPFSCHCQDPGHTAAAPAASQQALPAPENMQPTQAHSPAAPAMTVDKPTPAMRMKQYLDDVKQNKLGLKHNVLDESTRLQDEFFNKALDEAQPKEAAKAVPVATPARATTPVQMASLPVAVPEQQPTCVPTAMAVEPEPVEVTPWQTYDVEMQMNNLHGQPVSETTGTDETALSSTSGNNHGTPAPPQPHAEQQQQPTVSEMLAELIEDLGVPLRLGLDQLLLCSR